ncbi:aspartyl-tRNA synthetase [Lactarius akahatsu]|uniref:Aspartate--tRNA ligase, cytoplasmic n=1 Tax=Lactarius akahatsu TaxID=416441 RepID=A0AAD4LF93_9AGAM|nr:aspartyl-tRNA synthetase [Lactarius akahatsu]
MSSADPKDGKSLESKPEEPSKNELKKRAKAAEKEKKAAEKAAKLAEQQREREEAEEREAQHDFALEFYGKLPLNQSQSRPGNPRHQIASLSSQLDGQHVVIRARVHTLRAQGNKMVFFNLRQRTDSVQALLSVEDGKVSKFMVKWASGLASESIVLVEGTVKKSPEEIKSATIKDVELQLTRVRTLLYRPSLLNFSRQIHLISGLDDRLPFTIDDASRPDGEKDENSDVQFNRVLLDTRLNNRVVDLRTQTNQAIFKLQSAIGTFFREYLDSRGFTEIHSPKLQGAATESGASVFKVSYFKGNAFLAQSPQLAKQMAIAADFERVYEIGPVFRAEDSNTHRHLTEYIGLDLEMTIEEHYHEVMELLDDLFKHLFQSLKEKYKKEIDVIGAQFPAEEFKWKEETLKLTFSQAVNLLVEDGVDRAILDDINTENEKRLGRIVKAKYDTDYFIIDKFPMELRPFYTMPDPSNPELSNSYDFFMRGEEILSGAQRIHDPAFLTEKMRGKGVDPNSMKGYVDAFRMGCAPHGGGGIGLERVLMLFLKLNNIRRASLFPRDPKRLEP